MSDEGVSFRLTAEQRELQALAHEFAERELRPIAAEWDVRDDFPPDLLRAGGRGRAHRVRRPGRVRRRRHLAAHVRADRGGALVGLRRPRGDAPGDDVPGPAARRLRQRGAALALPAADRLAGGLPLGDRLHGAGRGLRRRRDRRDRPPRGRRVRPRRREVLRHERRDRGRDRPVRASSTARSPRSCSSAATPASPPAARSASSACARRTPARSCSTGRGSLPTACSASPARAS